MGYRVAGVPFSGASSLVANAYAGRAFRFREDWQFGKTMYQSLAGGQSLALSHYNVVMESSGGTARLIPITGSQRMGLLALVTGETADGQCRVTTAAAGAFDSLKYSRISYEAVLAFEAAPTVAQDFTAEVGLVGNAPGYGCYFRLQRSVGGLKWMAVNEHLGTETVIILDGTTQLGVVTVNTESIDALSLPSYGFYRLKVIAYANSDGTAGYSEFYVSSTNTGFLPVKVATLTTNMPGHSLAGSVEILKTAGTTARYLALDYTELSYDLRGDRNP